LVAGAAAQILRKPQVYRAFVGYNRIEPNEQREALELAG
jgi:hypothetical protein